jgi:aminomethyltransferase
MMPIQYTRIADEHMAARERTAVFDTCHMGEIMVRGEHALAQLGRIISSDIELMDDMRCKNGFLLNEQGGIIDDLIVYRMSATEYMLVVNASSQEQDFEWLQRHLSDDVSVDFVSSHTAKIDVQGPGSPGLLQSLIDTSLASLCYYAFMKTTYHGYELLISRTGYTGEMGFEIYCENDVAPELWNACIDAGAVAAGLGARDTLRLEIGLPLHGHELTEERNAAQTGYGFILSKRKEYIGREAVQSEEARTEKLVAMVLQGRQAARQGEEIVNAEGARIGTVTSGSFSPCLQTAIALGYVDRDYSSPGTAVHIRKRKKLLDATIEKKPLYTQATARDDITRYL